MKKKLLLFALLLPVVTFAATCDPVINTVNTNSREITCDASKSTVTTFRTENEIEVLDSLEIPRARTWITKKKKKSELIIRGKTKIRKIETIGDRPAMLGEREIVLLNINILNMNLK